MPAFSLTALELGTLVSTWMWPFLRISALITAAPLFGHHAVPRRARIGLALLLTLIIVPGLPAPPAVDPFSGLGLLIGVHQVLIGLAIGFAARLAFAVLELAGQLIAHLMGLGFANMVDPSSGINVPVLSQLYIVLATLVFLAIDGHLVVVQVLAESFVALPVGGAGPTSDAVWTIVVQGGWVFAAALLMALPAVAALLTVNLAFGVMTRAAPQLNIFAVGFPVTMLFGFAIVFLTLPSILWGVQNLFEHSLSLALGFVGGTP